MDKICPVSESPLDSFRGRRPHATIVEMFKGKRCWRVAVRCPFCKDVHLHGAGETNTLPNLGQRRAHCSKGSYFIAQLPKFAISQRVPTVVSDDPDSVLLQVL